MPTTTIEIHVQPRAGRNRIVTKDGTLKAYVTAAPEKGRANKAVVEAIAQRLRVPKGAVSIVSGERSRKKRLRVEGLSDEDALCRLGE